MAVDAFHCAVQVASCAVRAFSQLVSARSMMASACLSAWFRSNWASISGFAQARADVGVGLEEGAEVALAAEGLHRVALHEHVRLLPPMPVPTSASSTPSLKYSPPVRSRFSFKRSG